MPLSRNPDVIWADGPGGMPTEPFKPDIRAVMKEIEQRLDLHISSNGLIYPSKTAINADLAHDANSMAWVLGDPIAANNGVYGKIGASGAGSWTRRADLPFSFIIASDAGAGAPNAIQATTNIPVSQSALIWMNVAQTNTAGAVTVQFNGEGPVYPIKTNSGNDTVAEGLVAGMVVLGILSGATFRLVSDQASAAIIAAAEGWANIAQAAANGNLVFVTKAAAAAATIGSSVHSVSVKGGLSETDGKGGLFVDVDNGSTDTFTSADGRTWYRARDVSEDRVSDTLRRLMATSSPFVPKRDMQSGYVYAEFGSAGTFGDFQNHAFDTVNRHLYTLQHKSDTDGLARIKRLNMDVYDDVNEPTPVDTLTDSALIGHQVLEIEYLPNGAIKLWGAGGPTSLSRDLVRFDYVAGGAPANLQTFTIFDPAIMGTATMSASISPDQRWLVARGFGSSLGGEFASLDVIAVFDFDELVAAGPGNRWDLARYMWSYPAYMIGGVKQSLQSIVCDGTFVFLVFGPSPIANPNKILTYSLDGKFVEDSGELIIGKTDAAALNGGTGNFNEIEGVKLVQFAPGMPIVPTVGFIQGNQGGPYYKRIYVGGAPFPKTGAYANVNMGGAPQALSANTISIVNWAGLTSRGGVDFSLANDWVIPRRGQQLRLKASLSFSGLTTGQELELFILQNGDTGAPYRRTGGRPAIGAKDRESIDELIGVGDGVTKYSIAARVGSGGGTIDGTLQRSRCIVSSC